MRVLWVGLVMATSLAGCTEVPQVEGWPCQEDRKVVSETLTFHEGKPMGNGNEGWWTWQLAVDDACPPAVLTGSVDVVAQAAALERCKGDQLAFQMTLSSPSASAYHNPTYHNGATPRLDGNGAYHYESALPDVWYGPAGYTEKPLALLLEVLVSHTDSGLDSDTTCVESLVDTATLTLEYLPLKDATGA